MSALTRFRQGCRGLVRERFSQREVQSLHLQRFLARERFSWRGVQLLPLQRFSQGEVQLERGLVVTPVEVFQRFSWRGAQLLHLQSFSQREVQLERGLVATPVEVQLERGLVGEGFSCYTLNLSLTKPFFGSLPRRRRMSAGFVRNNMHTQIY